MTTVLARHLPVWTEEDIARQLEDGSKYEILDGSLHVTPPADEFHQGVCFLLGISLHRVAPPGWRVRTDIGLKVGDDRLVPDVVVLRPDAPRGAFYTDGVHCAVVVEVESASTRTNDRGNKLLKYAEAGIPSYWRIERSDAGPVVHIYELSDDAAESHHATEYHHVATVRPGESFTASRPYPVAIIPAELVD